MYLESRTKIKTTTTTTTKQNLDMVVHTRHSNAQRQRQEVQKFKVTLSYLVRGQQGYMRPCLNEAKERKPKSNN